MLEDPDEKGWIEKRDKRRPIGKAHRLPQKSRIQLEGTTKKKRPMMMSS